jgi:hypothetical protein
MMFPGEIRYLDVAWINERQIRSVCVSDVALDVQFDGRGFSVETFVFPKSGHHVGIRLDAQTYTPPSIRLANGETLLLMPVSAPGSSQVWWIFADGWNEAAGRYYSLLYRTVGRTSVSIGNYELLIENHSVNFTVDELEHYLADFKNGLWELVLDNRSASTLKVSDPVGAFVDQEVLSYLNKFCDFAERVVNSPVIHLAEGYSQRPLDKVRPTTTTFRELATRPGAMSYTSRSRFDNVDIPDNRFAHYCVSRVYQIVISLQRMVNGKEQLIVHQIERSRQRLHEIDSQLSGHSSVAVDPRIFDAEVETIRQQCEKCERSVVLKHTASNAEAGESNEFLLRSPVKDSPDVWYVREINNYRFPNVNHDYALLDLSSVASFEDSSAGKGCKLLLVGTFQESVRTDSKGRHSVKFTYQSLKSARLLNQRLREKLSWYYERRCKLESDGWMRRLTGDEIKALRSEREEIQQSIDGYQTTLSVLALAKDGLPGVLKRMKRILREFEQRGISISSAFPNSMVYVSNANYSSLWKVYKKLISKTALSKSALDSLLQINNIGLVSIASLYERWCLIRVVKVLHEVFGFNPESGWQDKLVNAVSGQRHDVDIHFSAGLRQQEIVLSYEKVLENGKRPDFVIDLRTYHYEKSNESWFKGGTTSNQLMLDAKFRGDMSSEKMRELVWQLYDGKNYSGNGKNPVFVLHPVAEVVDQPTSPLVWGRRSDYGHEHRHRYGFIYLSPVFGGGLSGTDDLQRLIGMFLQKHSVVLKSSEQNGDSPEWTNLVCIGCGNTADETLRLALQRTMGGNASWRCYCPSCHLTTVITRCASCGEALYKNGNRWTYHRTKVEQTSNVVCPSCSTFL